MSKKELEESQRTITVPKIAHFRVRVNRCESTILLNCCAGKGDDKQTSLSIAERLTTRNTQRSAAEFSKISNQSISVYWR